MKKGLEKVEVGNFKWISYPFISIGPRTNLYPPHFTGVICSTSESPYSVELSCTGTVGEDKGHPWRMQHRLSAVLLSNKVIG